MLLDLSNRKFHLLMRTAVKRMERMGSQPNIDIALHAYTERQLVFEIGQQFRNYDPKLWVAFEQRYPTPAKQPTRQTADIVVLEKPGGNIRNQNLWIQKTEVSDNSIPIITNFKKLKKLDISGTKITSDGIKIIKSKLPKCEITSGD